MISDEHLKRLTNLIEQWECAASLCDAVVQKFQPVVDEFLAIPRDNTKTYDIRLIRSVQDEKSNRDTLLKDTAALKALMEYAQMGDNNGN